MEDFLPSDGRYAYDDASDHPAYVLHFSARDLARFGWLYLNKGKWRDKQVVPEAWVAESTKPYSETDRGTSYGYLWWVAPRNVQFRTEVGPGAFSARGNGGQYVMVMPAPRIVVVHLNDWGQGQNSKLGTHEFGNLLQLIIAAAPR
jgi:CubicO group peptidase (beta-lactamase class C family)